MSTEAKSFWKSVGSYLYRFIVFVGQRIAAAWHYIWALLADDPKNDITFCIFAASSITVIVLIVTHMGKLNDNDIIALTILQSGGTVPQSIKTASGIIEALKTKIAR